MNFSEAESYLYSLGNEVAAMKLGLENIKALLAGLGDPQKGYLKVQVAGTNGKGSVCAFVDSICGVAGIRRGLYTSPHLVSITERIKIDGADISEQDFARLATRVRETAEAFLSDSRLSHRPTFFEQVTAIGLLAFAEAKVELAILETGLGGRLDATTAAGAEIAAITQIAMDHQEHLGSTIEEIAGEKAAIIRKSTRTLVVGKQLYSAALDVVIARCAKLGIEPILADVSCRATFDEGTSEVVFPSVADVRVRLGLAGRHQIDNAQMAAALAGELRQRFPITDLNIVAGLEQARHPGRLEFAGRYLFDGAHNEAGAKAVADFLDEFETRPITMIYGTMREKDIEAIARVLFPKAENLILTTPDNSRAMPAAELVKFAGGREVRVCENAGAAIKAANEIAGDGLVLVTGSLYLVGEVKKILNNQ